MAIIIVRRSIQNDPETGQPSSRAAYIYITDGSTAYMFNRGGIALTGDLQTILNAEEADLWAWAVAGGQLPTPTELEIVAAIQWYVGNNGAKVAVFDKSAAQSVTDVTNLVASIAGLNAAQRTGLVQLLLSALWDTRVNARERGLV